MTTIIALILFFSTLETDINGSHHPYATDVGEIQNAFPRWGLIHYSSYPLCPPWARSSPTPSGS